MNTQFLYELALVNTRAPSDGVAGDKKNEERFLFLCEDKVLTKITEFAGTLLRGSAGDIVISLKKHALSDNFFTENQVRDAVKRSIEETKAELKNLYGTIMEAKGSRKERLANKPIDPSDRLPEDAK